MIGKEELFLHIVRMKHTRAFGEHERLRQANADPVLVSEWRGQEIAFKQLIDIAEGKQAL